MTKIIKIAAILSIVIALIVPLIVAFNAQSDVKNLPVIKVKIAAYDPRDLLYGHYMTYRYDWNWKGGKADDAACYGDSCCLCAGDSAVDPEVQLIQCPAKGQPQTCAHIIKGTYHGDSRFDTGNNRYYVDETIALPLEDLFRKEKETFRVGLGVSPQGRTVVEGLYIGDQSLPDYLKDHGDALLKPAEPAQPE